MLFVVYDQMFEQNFTNISQTLCFDDAAALTLPIFRRFAYFSVNIL
jgi:hypothetical protein